MMPAIESADIIEFFKDHIRKPDEQFAASAYYDHDGDCIEFFAKADPYYAKRIDDLVTVYLSMDTDEVVGSLIKGVKQFIREAQKVSKNAAVIIDDGKVRISHLLLLGPIVSGSKLSEVQMRIYKKLISVADESNSQADLCGV